MSPMSGRHQPDVGQTSGLCRPDVGPMSGPDVGPTSARHSIPTSAPDVGPRCRVDIGPIFNTDVGTRCQADVVPMLTPMSDRHRPDITPTFTDAVIQHWHESLAWPCGSPSPVVAPQQLVPAAALRLQPQGSSVDGHVRTSTSRC
jgi:hypothetical protein